MTRTKEDLKEYAKNYYIKNRDKLLARSKEYEKNNPRSYERTREMTLMREYGLTMEQYNMMMFTQNNRCYICGLEETALYKGQVTPLRVDHCHETGAVRKLLCHRHNAGLGLFNHDSDLLRAAADYIDEHKGGIS